MCELELQFLENASMSKLRRFFAVLLIFTFSFSLFANQPTVKIDEYREGGETPSWLKNLRRSEIVTLGSLPFTTLSTTFAYSLYKGMKNGFQDGIPNPLEKDKSGFTTDEQLGIFFTSLSISLLIGVTDFVVSTVKEKKSEKQHILEMEEQNQAVILEVVE